MATDKVRDAAIEECAAWLLKEADRADLASGAEKFSARATALRWLVRDMRWALHDRKPATP